MTEFDDAATAAKARACAALEACKAALAEEAVTLDARGDHESAQWLRDTAALIRLRARRLAPPKAAPAGAPEASANFVPGGRG